MPFTLKQLRYFLAVAEAGQISAAAASVNVSQSAMTLAIQDLEAALGARLFDRRSTGLDLTREGEAFLVHASTIHGEVRRAEQSVRSPRKPLAGRMTLGVTDTLSGYFLMPRLSRFRRENPDLDLSLREAPRSELEGALLADEIDMALLLTSNLEAVEALETRTFHRSRRRLWTAAGHPLLDRAEVSLADLSGTPFVLLKTDEAERRARGIWARHGMTPPIAFETTSIEAVRSMVAQGLAVTILSDVVFRSWTVDGLRVLRRDLVEELPTMDVGVAWRRGEVLTPQQAAFIDLFEPGG